MKRILVLICVLSLTLTGCAGRKKISTDINHYAADCAAIKNAAKFMPPLDELSAYDDIRYTHQHTIYSYLMGFSSDGLALFVTYNEENYALQKELALSRYVFLEEPVRDRDTYTLPLTEFDYRGYRIRVIPDEEYIDYCACKSFAMLGVNDELHALVYLYFYDFDLDYIALATDDPAEEMREHMDTAFAWVE
jgi:hypothetical protein